MIKTIAIDVMGGDFGSSVTIKAALNALQQHEDLRLILVGLSNELNEALKKSKSNFSDRLEIVPVSEVVSMDESPGNALRFKKNSSLRVVIDLVKSGRAKACVSAGNTGALMAIARFVLKTLPNVDRPALMARFPARKFSKETRVLDLGANVDSTPAHLMQFAVMGSIVAETIDGCSKPSVGLLNVGVEDIKGNEQVKETARLLSQCDAINYYGYIEGDDIFTGIVDVVVCDGFVGNIALKACEGVVQLITEQAKKEMKRGWLSQLSILPALPILHRLKKHIDPRKRNGASLLGLNGIVIKSHGSADEIAFYCAIKEAMLEVQNNIPKLISQRVAEALQCIQNPELSTE